MHDIGLARDAINLPADADDRRNMVLPMVLNIEQVEMGLDD